MLGAEEARALGQGVVVDDRASIEGAEWAEWQNIVLMAKQMMPQYSRRLNAEQARGFEGQQQQIAGLEQHLSRTGLSGSCRGICKHGVHADLPILKQHPHLVNLQREWHWQEWGRVGLQGVLDPDPPDLCMFFRWMGPGPCGTVTGLQCRHQGVRPGPQASDTPKGHAAEGVTWKAKGDCCTVT